jgi:hypothetical protein
MMNEIALSGPVLYVVLAFAAFGIILLAINIVTDRRINQCPKCMQWVALDDDFIVDADGDAVHKECPNG